MDDNLKYKTTKLLGKCIEENLQDTELDKEFLDLTPKAISIKGKSQQWKNKSN